MNYRDVKAGLEQQKAENEAQNGLLPEGRYRVKLKMYKAGETFKTKQPTHNLAIQIQAPGTIYHRAERNIMIRDAKDYYAIKDLEMFLDAMNAWGADFSACAKCTTEIEAKKLFEEVCEGIADLHPNFEVTVENKTDRDGNVDPKYQDIKIVIESCTRAAPIQAAEPVAKRPVAKPTPKPIPEPEPEEGVGEGEFEEEQAQAELPSPPVAPKKSAIPSPFGRK